MKIIDDHYITRDVIRSPRAYTGTFYAEEVHRGLDDTRTIV